MGEFGLSGYEKTGYWQLLQLPANSPLNQAVSIHNFKTEERKRRREHLISLKIYCFIWYFWFVSSIDVKSRNKKKAKQD